MLSDTNEVIVTTTLPVCCNALFCHGAHASSAESHEIKYILLVQNAINETVRAQGTCSHVYYAWTYTCSTMHMLQSDERAYNCCMPIPARLTTRIARRMIDFASRLQRASIVGGMWPMGIINSV